MDSRRSPRSSVVPTMSDIINRINAGRAVLFFEAECPVRQPGYRQAALRHRARPYRDIGPHTPR